MQFSISRYLAFAVVILSLPAQSAFARSHDYSHHGFRHHHLSLASAHRYRAAANAQVSNTPFGLQFPFAFGAPVQQPQQRVSRRAMAPQGFAGFASIAAPSAGQGSGYEGMVSQQASANGVPASLVHRVIMRESRYNPRAVSRGNYGLMQIRLGTARSMGYGGSAEGLLDANTNMTYAVRYLAGAYRAAGGDENRAVALYARGYSAGNHVSL
jgi:soluble lytic murein transglycosylase-like protein